jgi:hypothetical protein
MHPAIDTKLFQSGCLHKQCPAIETKLFQPDTPVKEFSAIDTKLFQFYCLYKQCSAIETKLFQSGFLYSLDYIWFFV